MNKLDDYEKFVDSVWVSAPKIEYENEWHKKYMELRSLAITTMGLGGEAGEAIEKVKKFIRDGTFDREAIIKELGDVQYYVVRTAHDLGIKWEEVIDGNVKKLSDRVKNDTIRGSGDSR